MDEDLLTRMGHFLTNYILEIDRILPKIEIAFDENKKDVLKAAWYGIKMNSIWLLKYLRANMCKDHISPIPYYEIAFACRLLMEISSDFNYLFTEASDDEVKTFLKERCEIVSEEGILNEEILQQKYSDKYRLDKSTGDRIKHCYGDAGIAHYASLCWSTHFNYIGYIIASQEILNWKLRIYDILYILISINTFHDTLRQVCLSDANDLQPLRTEAGAIKIELETYIKTLEDVNNV